MPALEKMELWRGQGSEPGQKKRQRVVQWLGLHTFTAGGTGSIPGPGAKIWQAVECSPAKKEKEKENPHRKCKSVQ